MNANPNSYGTGTGTAWFVVLNFNRVGSVHRSVCVYTIRY